LPESLGSWTGTIHAAIAILNRPAAGVYGLRLKSVLESHPEVKLQTADLDALLTAAQALGERLVRLAWWSNPQHDAGWQSRAVNAARALLASAGTSTPVRSELEARVRDGERVVNMSASGGAKRCAAEWRRLSAEASTEGTPLSWKEHAPRLRAAVWQAMGLAQSRRVAELDEECESPRPWTPGAPPPCGGITSGELAKRDPREIAGCFPVPDPVHATRAAYKAKHERKAHYQRVRAARMKRERAATVAWLAANKKTRARVELAPCDGSCTDPRRTEDHAAHVVAWRAEQARIARRAKQARGAVDWRDPGLRDFEGNPRPARPVCSCCNMRLPLRLVAGDTVAPEVECPACNALLLLLLLLS
jgi:hypothetical protein